MAADRTQNLIDSALHHLEAAYRQQEETGQVTSSMILQTISVVLEALTALKNDVRDDERIIFHSGE